MSLLFFDLVEQIIASKFQFCLAKTKPLRFLRMAEPLEAKFPETAELYRWQAEKPLNALKRSKQPK
jgi:hypothetical protein